MTRPKSLAAVYSEFKESLYEWMRLQKEFDVEDDWSEGIRSPSEIYQMIEDAAQRIYSSLRIIEDLPQEETGEDLILSQMEYLRLIKNASMRMREALEEGKNSMMDLSTSLPRVFVAWKGLCVSVEYFVIIASWELSAHRDMSEIAVFEQAVRSLEATADVAKKCRKRVSNRRNLED